MPPPVRTLRAVVSVAPPLLPRWLEPPAEGLTVSDRGSVRLSS